MLSFIL